MTTLNPPKVMGHRGAPTLAPENTIEGFKAAFEAGGLWTETDVCLLGDGTPVIHHDSTLDRCTDRSGSIAQLTKADLGGVNANRQYPDRPFHAIPTLEQTLVTLGAWGMGLNLELKLHDHVKPVELVEAVLPILANTPFPADQMLLSSFDFDVLRLVRQQDENAALAVIAENATDEVFDLAAEIGAQSLNLWWETTSYADVQRALEAGLSVNVWTTNEPDKVASMPAWGVHSFISNCPQDFTAFA